MNIGMMCHSSLGGSVRIGTELSAELARRGHSVHLFTLGVPFGAWGTTAGVTPHPVPPHHLRPRHPSDLYVDWSTSESDAFLERLLHVIETDRLDVLHFHYAVPFAFLAARLKHTLGQASPGLVGTLHGTDVSIYGRDAEKGPLLSEALMRLDAVTTVSLSHARLSAEVFGLPHPPQVIPNFVDLDRFHPRRRRETSGPAGFRAGGEPGLDRPARIVHVSNLRPIKAIESVTLIFLGIRRRLEAELWLVGDGPDIAIAKSLLEENGYSSDLVLWGLCDDVAPVLASADLLLMPSHSESFCLAALEAMACGVPVLATNVGGLPEVVVDGETGSLFQLGDYSTAVDLAVGLLSDRQMHSRMSMAGRAHAEAFDVHKIVPAYERLYSTIRDLSSENRWSPTALKASAGSAEHPHRQALQPGTLHGT